MRFHLEGMGVQGALLAHFLRRAGYDFTWHDIDLPQTAWKACTGAIYPSGSTKFGDDHRCHAQWAQWHSDGLLGWDVLEPAHWWFNHKGKPPHEATYKPSERTEHGLRSAPLFSYHFNAQRFVERTRERFAERRLVHPPVFSDAYVVTHGWSERQAFAYWGWTRHVTLAYDAAIYGSAHARPAFYFREGRFIMAYAYPVPGTSYWYAGSSIIKQAAGKTRSLEIPAKYERWKENFERLSGGAVRVTGEGYLYEGWRPVARDASWAQVTTTPQGVKHVTLRPLWNNGVRHFPQQLGEFARLVLPQGEALW